MTDLFSELATGEALLNFLSLSFTADVAIVKGDFVKMATHTAGVIGTVTPITSTGDPAVGMAIQAAALGAEVSVCVIGVVKVQASAGITLGQLVKTCAPTSGYTGSHEVIYTATSVIGTVGKALQTFADKDTGLILMNCAGGM